MIKKLIPFPFTCALLLFGADTALAVFHHTGTIAGIHYNTLIAGRGVCVRTIPRAPTEWFCLKERHLSKEINDLLRDAYIGRRRCVFSWTNTLTGGFADLEAIECYN